MCAPTNLRESLRLLGSGVVLAIGPRMGKLGGQARNQSMGSRYGPYFVALAFRRASLSSSA